MNLYVVSCCRTAIGSFGGSLKGVSAPELGAIAAAEAMKRAKIEPKEIDELIFGCILSAGLGMNVARQVSVKAGIPVERTAATVNMVCGSGMKSVVDGARAILAGDADIILAGGTENMSQAPYLFPAGRWGARMSDSAMIDSMVRDGLWDVYGDYHMGITAEHIAERWQITREQQDLFALASQTKALKAKSEGKFIREIVAVPIREKRETMNFCEDEYPRVTSMEALSKLRPAFKPDGTVTAGNASGINDGAAALVLASEDAVKRHGLRPMARLAGWGQAGVDPAVMGIGPVEAVKKAMQKAGVSIGQLDLIESNEAFAVQSIAVARDLGLDQDKVNVNGGAIALGHPIGASGARIIVSLLHEMEQRTVKYGLATLCIGGGMGIATIFEKC